MNFDCKESDGQMVLPDLEESETAAARARVKAPAPNGPDLTAIPYLHLDFSPDHVDLFGSHYWEMRSPYRVGRPPLNTGPAPRVPDRVTLSGILEPEPDPKYYLSRRACQGILRRAEARGRELPEQLEAALRLQAGLAPAKTRDCAEQRDLLDPIAFAANQQDLLDPIAFAANQREEVRDLHDVAGALSAQPGMKQQTFVAGFSAGAGASAGSVGYSEEVAPTLKSAASGNCMPSVLCLNDQGGSMIDCSENVSGTLRAQENGHQPLVLATQQGGAELGVGVCPTITAAAGMSGNNQPVLFENHGVDSRYTGPRPVSPTLSARAGTGGSNLPLVEQDAVIFSRQRADKFTPSDMASTESARQHKDATDLVCQASSEERPLLIRRLTPLECERLQGFPDGWTDQLGAADSARYRALGNSVAIPCVEFVLRGIALAAGHKSPGWQKQASSWSLTTPVAWRNE